MMLPFSTALLKSRGEYCRIELEAQVPDEQSTTRCTTDSLFCAFVVDVDVRDSKVGARLVGCPLRNLLVTTMPSTVHVA